MRQPASGFPDSEKSEYYREQIMLSLLTQAKKLFSSPANPSSVFTRAVSLAQRNAVFQPLPLRRNGENAMKYLHKELLKKFDPYGKRSELVHPKTGVRAGDILKVTYLDRSTVFGRVLGVKRGQNNLGTNILLRNRITKLGCEIRVPVFNPKIANIEILERPDTYLSRNKHFYVRNSKNDVGDIEAMIRKRDVEKAKSA